MEAAWTQFHPHIDDILWQQQWLPARTCSTTVAWRYSASRAESSLRPQCISTALVASAANRSRCPGSRR